MDRSAKIRAKLEQAFDAQVIEVFDESEAHRGHAGYQEGGQSHFRVVVKAPEFAQMNRLARHRAVHGAIGAELMGEIHALALDLSA
ncbi:BolA family transcriptional regulator [Litorivita pollutaquae]|uniref:BolA family transcriptional regulator n=1 Tax=Litorivita pollutaquae TaxID=2200892 RepID=A0A2V4NUC0_9RHOB|nr:BolA family protein [Litorivita pollutaquae]OUS22105.1 BolA family transcriptional regulator [Rhodobacterales bacterium 59_46_T64]PYC48576.1 BolA family transcriptional regulator [Litorivita pollutaquae]